MYRKILGLVAVLATLPLAACDDGTGALSPGTLSLMLTDAAGDFTQAQVTIERIELVGDGEPLVLLDAPFTTDLLTLSNDIASLTEDVTVPGGTYTQLRFIIPEACIGVEQEDESELVYASTDFDACGAADGSLQLPSYDETGLKVGLPGGSIEVDGDSRILLLDFDVSQSFGQQAGMSGSWVMNPVIIAEDISLSGGIVVELTAADGVDLAALGASLADFEARLDTETEPQPFTDPGRRRRLHRQLPLHDARRDVRALRRPERGRHGLRLHPGSDVAAERLPGQRRGGDRRLRGDLGLSGFVGSGTNPDHMRGRPSGRPRLLVARLAGG